MRSLRSRTVENDWSEQDVVETEDNNESVTRKKKIHKSKKAKKISKEKFFADEADENTENLANAFHVNDLTEDFHKSKNKGSSETVNTSMSSVTSDNIHSKKAKKTKKSSKKMKGAALLSSEEDVLKSDEQNLYNRQSEVSADVSSISEASEKRQTRKSKRAKKKESNTAKSIMLSPEVVVKNERNISPTTVRSNLQENKCNPDTTNTSINSVTSEIIKSKKSKKERKNSKRAKSVLLSPEDAIRNAEQNSATAKESESVNKKKLHQRFFDDIDEQIEETDLPKQLKTSKKRTSQMNITRSINEDDIKKDETSRKKKSKYFKTTFRNITHSLTDADVTNKSQNSLQGKYDERPSFLTLVTSTNKKQTPEIVVNAVITQENVKEVENEVSNKRNSSSVISDVHKNTSTSMKNSSTPKGKHSNSTYELVSSELSDIQKNKSPKIFSNLLEIHKNEAIYSLDDISEINMDEIINISDETLNSKRATFDVSNKMNGTLSEPNGKKPNEKQSESIAGHSGEWKIENLTETINISNEVNLAPSPHKSITNKTQEDTKKTPITSEFNEAVLTPSSKLNRKKWIKFALDSDEAKSLLEEIGTPDNKKCITKTPVPKRSLNVKKTPKPIYIKESKSDESKPKGSITRTGLPNFAKIHQRAFEKMESLKEYSERKKKRAQMLFSASKTTPARKTLQSQENVNLNYKAATPAKSSRELFKIGTPNDKFNKPDFKFNSSARNKTTNSQKKPIPKASKLPVRQFVAPKKIFSELNNVDNTKREPIFTRPNLIAAGNKMKQQNTSQIRDTKRNILKGVRTNRRFELLLQMRNK